MTAPQTQNPWLVCPQPNARAQFKLFCFTFAGGSSVAFHTWGRELPSSVEVTAIELPGRRRRYREPALRSISDVLAQLIPELAAASDRPYLIFGHSLGALIAFEVVRAFQRLGLSLPVLFMPSAAAAPHRGLWLSRMHDLPRAEFLSKLAEIGGTPPEILANDELVDSLLGAMRADFEIFASYRYEAGPALNCPIVAFAGSADRTVPYDDVAAWRHHTSSFKAHTLPSGHFFLKADQEELLALIHRELQAISR